MAKRKQTGKAVVVIHREVEVTSQQVVVEHERKPYVKPELTQVVMKVHQFCPICKSTRSRFLWSEPGNDGRMVSRLCLGCGNKFKTWDPDFRK